MAELSPVYLSDLASMLASVGAFLGGFAATYLATLITLSEKSRIMTATICCAAVSAVSFIVCVVASITLVATLHPQSPAMMGAFSPVTARATMGLAFFVGAMTLFGSLGLSGWTRSRTLGLITSGVSLAGALLTIASIYRS